MSPTSSEQSREVVGSGTFISPLPPVVYLPRTPRSTTAKVKAKNLGFLEDGNVCWAALRPFPAHSSSSSAKDMKDVNAPDGRAALAEMEDKAPSMAPATQTPQKDGMHVLVQSHAAVPAGHVVIGRSLREALGAGPFGKLRLIEPKRQPISLNTAGVKIMLHPITQTNSGASVAKFKLRPKDQPADASSRISDPISVTLFREWILRHTPSSEPIVLTDGMHLSINPLQIPPASTVATPPPSSPTPTSYLLRVQIEGKKGIKKEGGVQSEGKGSGDVEGGVEGKAQNADSDRYIVLRDRINAEELVVEEGEEVDGGSLSTKAAATTEKQEEDENVPQLGGVDDLLKDAVSFSRARLGSRVLKTALGAPNCIFIKCTELAHERIPKIKSTITDAIERAKWHAPSVIVLDDLDRIAGVEQENRDSTRPRHLAELFLDLFTSLISSSSTSPNLPPPLLFIATSQQQTTIHPLLTSSHVFGESLRVLPPGKKQREKMLQVLVGELVERTLSRDSAGLDFASIASTTEGYMPADLRTLVERAMHEAAMGAVQESERREEIGRDREGGGDGDGDGGEGKSLQLVQRDFVRAQVGYVPASLRGVKLQTSDVSWKDIGGLKETKRVLLETLEWPTKYAAIYAQCPLRLRSGLLLYGYPGCGKTLLASAVAKECGLHFISVKGPELLNKYIGASEKAVRDLFERAQAAKPCILFFDEFDSIAPRRGHDNTGVTDRVVNQLLTQMDGAEGLDGVYVLAATSRPDLIDPALLRPGRLDKSLLCNMPDEEERLDILRAVSRKLHISPTIDLRTYAHQTAHFSGADLQGFLYNAHLEAVHEILDMSTAGGASRLPAQQEEQDEEGRADHG
ncbi:Peroxisome biosynthesis protein pex1 [Quaeritorhiza haematococci]|nr:Peroxisome biosynthesis protein pex1 [Quaeritorhiza haematococci]